ncbi:MAG: hypothetical protein ACJ77N_04835 [Chloroflexota bacterium]
MALEDIPTTPVLRVLSFRPRENGSAFDAALRTEVMPDFVALPGLLEVHVGRRGSDDSGERVIVSVWDDDRAMRAALGDGPAEGRFHPELTTRIADEELRVVPLHAGLRHTGRGPAAVLRVFRGRADPGSSVDFRAAARTELRRLCAQPAFSGAFFGMDESGSFVTATTWLDWSAIEAWTGGDITRSGRSFGSPLDYEGDASHYEILPDVGHPPRASVASGWEDLVKSEVGA